MRLRAWALEDIDPDHPSAARVFDYWLGGSQNFASDRRAAEETTVTIPQVPYWVRTNRAFLGRAVRHLAAEGVRQFLDLGSGIPTVNPVHEVAQEVSAECRVVYVDIDPGTVAHSRTLLEGNDLTAVAQADLCRPTEVLTAPQTAALLDLNKPVAVLMMSILQGISDSDDPNGLIAVYAEALCPGSYLVISHPTEDKGFQTGTAVFAQLYGKTYGQGIPLMTLRDRQEIARLLDGFELVEPGVVPVPLWRPEENLHRNPEHFPAFAALGRKR